MARRKKSRKTSKAWLVWLLLAVVAGTAGTWYWKQHGPPVPSIEQLASLTTNIPQVWTNLPLPEIARETPPAVPQTNSPPAESGGTTPVPTSRPPDPL